MYNYRIAEQVFRKPKPLTGVLRMSMLIFAGFFLILGITVSQGFMLPGFLLVILYYAYNTFSQKEYEYILEGNHLTIDIIYGRKHRKSVHYLNMDALEVIAPNWHNAVAMYRKNGGSVRLPKYDYTSYEEDIPFYTMIITENRQKIKLLLDLSDEMLQMIKKRYPDKVLLS